MTDAEKKLEEIRIGDKVYRLHNGKWHITDGVNLYEIPAVVNTRLSGFGSLRVNIAEKLQETLAHIKSLKDRLETANEERRYTEAECKAIREDVKSLKRENKKLIEVATDNHDSYEAKKVELESLKQERDKDMLALRKRVAEVEGDLRREYSLGADLEEKQTQLQHTIGELCNQLASAERVIKALEAYKALCKTIEKPLKDDKGLSLWGNIWSELTYHRGSHPAEEGEKNCTSCIAFGPLNDLNENCGICYHKDSEEYQKAVTSLTVCLLHESPDPHPAEEGERG